MPSGLSEASGLPSSLPGVLAGWGVPDVCPSAVGFCMAGPDRAEGAELGVAGGGVVIATPSALVSLLLSSAESSVVGVVGGAVLASVRGAGSVCVLWAGFA